MNKTANDPDSEGAGDDDPIAVTIAIKRSTYDRAKEAVTDKDPSTSPLRDHAA